MTISTLPPDRILLQSPSRLEPRFHTESKSDEFDLTSGFSLVRRRIVMIIGLVVVFMAVATPMIWGLKPTFYAETRLMINRPLAVVISAEDSVRNDPLDLTSEMERLLSRRVSERVINDLQLAKWPEFNPALQKPDIVTKIREKLRSLIEKREPAALSQDDRESVVLKYYSALRVSRDGSSDLIRIGFDSKDAGLAATVPNRLTSIYLEERNTSIRNRLDEAETWFSERISEQKKRVVAAHDAADSYQATVAATPDTGGKGETNSFAAELIKQKAKIEVTRVEIKAIIASLEENNGNYTALQTMTLPEGIKAMLNDIGEMERNLAVLQREYVNDADTVVAARAAILTSQANLRVAVDRYIQSMRDKLAALDVEDRSIGSTLATTQEQQSRSILAQANLARLQRIADNEQKELDKLEERRRALAGQAMLPGAEVEILSPAAVPITPKGRGRAFYLIGALLASVSLAVTAAFIVEMFDRSVRSFDQMSSISRIIPAGFIPHLRKADQKNATIHFGGVRGGMLDDALNTVIRSIKMSNGGKLPGSIAVTSVRSGDGKSLVAKCLAIELVANGHSVLLVDCDLRRKSRRPLFDEALEPGLNEFLSSQVKLRDVVRHHRQSGVDYITAGVPDLRHRPSLTDMSLIVEMARASGRIVIFDSGPAMTSADTLSLVALAERTLLVAQWGKTSRRAFEFGVQQLKSSTNAELLIAINNVKPRKHARYNFSDSELFVGA